MRLNMMILGIDVDTSTSKIDLSYYQFAKNASDTTSRIVTWGNGTCGHNDNKLNTNHFNFKITKFDPVTSPNPPIYVVSMSSSFGGSISLLPLPDDFIKISVKIHQKIII